MYLLWGAKAHPPLSMFILCLGPLAFGLPIGDVFNNHDNSYLDLFTRFCMVLVCMAFLEGIFLYPRQLSGYEFTRRHQCEWVFCSVARWNYAYLPDVHQVALAGMRSWVMKVTLINQTPQGNANVCHFINRLRLLS